MVAVPWFDSPARFFSQGVVMRKVFSIVVMLGSFLIGGFVAGEAVAQRGTPGGGSDPFGTPGQVPRSGKRIEFEVVLIDRSAGELKEETNIAPTAAQLLELEKKGKLNSVQRLKLMTLENVEARLQLGEESPLVTSRTRGARDAGGFPGGGGFGGGSESVTYTSLGTIVTVTANIDEGKVAASLTLQRTSLTPQKPAEKVEGQEAVSTNYPRKGMTTISTSVRLTPGETMVVSGQQTLTGGTPSELWVLVTARLD